MCFTRRLSDGSIYDAGFEIDLADIDSMESLYLKTWISLYKRVRELLPQSHLYKLNTDDDKCAVQVVSEDQNFSLVLIQQLGSHVDSYSKTINLCGIAAHKSYKISVISEHAADCHLYKRLQIG